jgi:hypothetical protein
LVGKKRGTAGSKGHYRAERSKHPKTFGARMSATFIFSYASKGLWIIRTHRLHESQSAHLAKATLPAFESAAIAVLLNTPSGSS